MRTVAAAVAGRNPFGIPGRSTFGHGWGATKRSFRNLDTILYPEFAFLYPEFALFPVGRDSSTPVLRAASFGSTPEETSALKERARPLTSAA